MGGEDLAKICSKRIRRTQPKLHTHLHLQYTSAMAAIVNQRGCSWPDGRTMNAYKLGTNALPGWSGAGRNLFQKRSSNTA